MGPPSYCSGISRLLLSSLRADSCRDGKATSCYFPTAHFTFFCHEIFPRAVCLFQGNAIHNQDISRTSLHWVWAASLRQNGCPEFFGGFSQGTGLPSFLINRSEIWPAAAGLPGCAHEFTTSPLSSGDSRSTVCLERKEASGVGIFHHYFWKARQCCWASFFPPATSPKEEIFPQTYKPWRYLMR